MRFAYLLLPLALAGCDPCAGPRYLSFGIDHFGALPDGTPTNGPHSRVSGGGGEHDSHHTHDPRLKGE